MSSVSPDRRPGVFNGTMARRALLGLIIAPFADGVLGRVLGANPSYYVGWNLMDTIVGMAEDAFTEDSDAEYRRMKFREVAEHVGDLGGLDRAFPLPSSSPDSLKIVDWLLRRDLTGLATPVIRLNVGTAPSVNGAFGLRPIGTIPIDAQMEDGIKRVVGYGMNSKFGDKIDGDLFAEAPQLAYLNLLATGVAKSSNRHELPQPFGTEAVTTPEGILPLLLSGTKESLSAFGLRIFRAFGSLVESISVQRTGEDSLRFEFGKEVPIFGKGIDYQSGLVKDHYNAPWYNFVRKAPVLNKPADIVSVIRDEGGRALLDSVFFDMVRFEHNKAVQMLTSAGEAAESQLIYKERRMVAKDMWPRLYHPANFYVTEDGKVVRSGVQIHYIHISRHSLMVITSK